MKVYEWIDHCLAAYGCRTVFGVPGSLIMPVWQNLPDMDIVLCSHEGEASYAAVGHGKIKKKLTAVITTGGPGATNCISGIAGANLDSVPVIYISGCTPSSDMGSGLRQEEGCVDRDYDSVDMYSTATKKSIRVCSADEAFEWIEQGCWLAISDRAGSVHLSIPVDIQSAELGPINVKKLYKRAHDRLLGLRKSEGKISAFTTKGKTLIIMGWGCWMAEVIDDVYALATRLQAPVLVTTKAYCCIRNHPMYAGKLGYGENPVLDGFIAQYRPETVLAFGTSMGKKDISDMFLASVEGAEFHVFTMDVDSAYVHMPSAVWHETNDIKSQMEGIKSDEVIHVPALKEQLRFCREEQERYYMAHTGHLDIMAKETLALNNLLRVDTIVTADAGNHLLNAGALLRPEKTGSVLLLDDGIRAMGSGICETVGMAVAKPDGRFVAITGDGCMLMNGSVLRLAKQRNVPVLFVVMVNQSLGRVRVGQMSMGNRFISTDLDNINFLAYAKSFGLLSAEVLSVDVFQRYVELFYEEPEPMVLVCHVDVDEIPIPLRARGEWN